MTACPACGQLVTVNIFPTCKDCSKSLEHGVFHMLEGEARINLCVEHYRKAIAKYARKAKRK
jgi:hypothetical protein